MTIKLPDDRNFYVISRFMSMGTRYGVVITPITKVQEKTLDLGGAITIGDNNYDILNDDIYCYGEIDFSNNDDLDTIKRFDWVLEKKGEIISAHYDYETHTCESINNVIGHEETSNNIKIAMHAYAHCGKPERCIIFKIRHNDIKQLFNDFRKQGQAVHS